MLDLTTKIVAAYLKNNPAATSEISDLVRSVHAALVDVLQPEQEAVPPQAPFVSIKKSITPSAIICLECGKPQQMIKRHLHSAHGMTTDEYRAKWSLAADYPMVAPNYAAKRSQLAIASGLGQKRAKANIEDAKVENPAPPTNKYPASRWSRPKS